MTLKQQLGKLKWKNFLFLTVAGMVNAFGVTMFIAPVDLYDSGISGTSILLSQLTPEWLSLSLFLLVLNIPLFLYGLRKQGVVFTIYAIYTVAVYSFGAWLITDVLPVDVSIVSPLAGSPVSEAVWRFGSEERWTVSKCSPSSLQNGWELRLVRL